MKNTINFTTAQEGFEILRSLYVNSEVSSGDFIDYILAGEDEEVEFDSSVPLHIKYEAIQIFRQWDTEDDEEMIVSNGSNYCFLNGVKVPNGVRVGLVRLDSLDHGISHAEENKKFEKIYNLFENASAIMVDGRITNDWSLEEKDEILQEVANDENPIVISIYGAKLDAGGSFYVPLEYYFDYSDLCDAQIESDHLIMKDESGASVPVYVFTNATSISDESQEEEMALQHEENGTDFILTGDRCYIAVNNLTVYVKKDVEGVAVDVWPSHDEDGDPIASTWSLYSEGEEDENVLFAKDQYEDGVCPDCGASIGATATKGDACDNCGHVFIWGDDDSDSEQEKAYCFSCKMDMHYDEIGNCKGCGNFIDGGAV